MKKTMSYWIVSALFGIPGIAFAEGSGGTRGGGDVIVCGEKVFLADTYDQRTKSASWSLNELNASPTEGEAIGKIENAIAYEFGVAAREFFQKSIERTDWKEDFSLPELDDDGIVDLPEGCTKQQVAIQRLLPDDSGMMSDDSRSEVSVNPVLYGKLTFAEKLYLRVHESKIRARLLGSSGVDLGSTTEQIRREVARLAYSDGLSFSLQNGSCRSMSMTFSMVLPTSSTLFRYSFNVGCGGAAPAYGFEVEFIDLKTKRPLAHYAFDPRWFPNDPVVSLLTLDIIAGIKRPQMHYYRQTYPEAKTRLEERLRSAEAAGDSVRAEAIRQCQIAIVRVGIDKKPVLPDCAI